MTTRKIQQLFCIISLLKFVLMYPGKDFVLGFLENRLVVDYPVARIYMSVVGSEPASVSVAVPGMAYSSQGSATWDYVNVTLKVVPGKVTVHEMLSEIHMSGTSVEEKAVVIQSDALISVQLASINDQTSDAYLALPVDRLGLDYFVMSYMFNGTSVFAQGPSELGVVAVADNTTVHVTLPSASVRLDLRRSGIRRSGNTLQLTLDKYQTFQLQSVDDLTGARVRVSRPAAVLSGAKWSSVTRDYMGDHLVEQLPPAADWGSVYLTASLVTRRAGDVFRVLAKSDSTSVSITLLGAYPTTEHITLSRAEYHQFEVESGRHAHLAADKPVLLAQFSKSYSADRNRKSDPFMALVQPLEQYSSSYVFATADNLHADAQNRYAHFLSLITTIQGAEGVLLDGKDVKSFEAVRQWHRIPKTEFMSCVLRIAEGSHRLNQRAGLKIGGMVYGMKHQETYGYPLGIIAYEPWHGAVNYWNQSVAEKTPTAVPFPPLTTSTLSPQQQTTVEVDATSDCVSTTDAVLTDDITTDHPETSVNPETTQLPEYQTSQSDSTTELAMSSENTAQFTTMFSPTSDMVTYSMADTDAPVQETSVSSSLFTSVEEQTTEGKTTGALTTDPAFIASTPVNTIFTDNAFTDTYSTDSRIVSPTNSRSVSPTQHSSLPVPESTYVDVTTQIFTLKRRTTRCQPTTTQRPPSSTNHELTTTHVERHTDRSITESDVLDAYKDPGGNGRDQTDTTQITSTDSDVKSTDSTDETFPETTYMDETTLDLHDDRTSSVGTLSMLSDESLTTMSDVSSESPHKATTLVDVLTTGIMDTSSDSPTPEPNIYTYTQSIAIKQAPTTEITHKNVDNKMKSDLYTYTQVNSETTMIFDNISSDGNNTRNMTTGPPIPAYGNTHDASVSLELILIPVLLIAGIPILCFIFICGGLTRCGQSAGKHRCQPSAIGFCCSCCPRKADVRVGPIRYAPVARISDGKLLCSCSGIAVQSQMSDTSMSVASSRGGGSLVYIDPSVTDDSGCSSNSSNSSSRVLLSAQQGMVESREKMSPCKSILRDSRKDVDKSTEKTNDLPVLGSDVMSMRAGDMDVRDSYYAVDEIDDWIHRQIKPVNKKTSIFNFDANAVRHSQELYAEMMQVEKPDVVISFAAPPDEQIETSSDSNPSTSRDAPGQPITDCPPVKPSRNTKRKILIA